MSRPKCRWTWFPEADDAGSESLRSRMIIFDRSGVESKGYYSLQLDYLVRCSPYVKSHLVFGCVPNEVRSALQCQAVNNVSPLQHVATKCSLIARGPNMGMEGRVPALLDSCPSPALRSVPKPQYRRWIESQLRLIQSVLRCQASRPIVLVRT